MSLTLGGGPLTAKDSPASNYEIQGPKHRIFWSLFPRAVRAELAGETVLDTRAGMLLHESQMLPVLYVPDEDLVSALFEPTDHATTCPFKGEASYWSIRVGDRVAENACWAYPEPNEETPWLAGHRGFYWDKLDAWYDEDERVHAHLRDPFHRVDVRPGRSRIAVSAGDETIAESKRPMVLSETGLPNRIYVPREDVRDSALTASPTSRRCPYKGESRYWSVSAGGATIEDAAWSYEEPFEDASRVAGMVCFLHDDLTVEVTPE